MRTTIKRVITVICTLCSLSLIPGCTKSEFFSEESSSYDSTATRGNGESSYYFYDYENKKIYLSLNTESIFFSVQELTQLTRLSADIAKYGAKTTEFKTDIVAKTGGGGVANRLYTELNFERDLTNEQYQTLLSDIKRQNKGAVIAPYFNDAHGNKIGLSNYFYVKLKDERTVSILEEMAGKFDCVIISQDEYMPLWYKLSVTETTEQTALECANYFHESGLFAAAEPDLIADLSLSSNDPYYPYQWGLNNTGQYGGTSGIDIMISNAWPISTGNDVIVAVIDTGVDLTHPDLAANIYPLSYDCQSGTTPQQVRGTHGTACAGIIGAVRGNGLGIAGVAPDCRIMSISHSLATGVSVREQLANGINWAWQNGADVISCSWGHATALSGSYITDAIFNAASFYGRGGKGCVTVFASGNENTSVSYPAILFNVIAAGAISYNGKRKSLSTPDGEPWGSNYGHNLNVMAPGVRIYTTSASGYTSYFNGTSAAAPHVAGVAALILSKYPDLQEKQVRRAIELGTTRLSGGYSYYPDDEYPTGLKNNEVGYGLVNAYEALRKASDANQLIIQDAIPGFDFTITNHSSYIVDYIFIGLTGKVGGSDASLIYHDPGGVGIGSVLGYPYYRGEDLRMAPGTAITDINLELYAYIWDYSGPVRIGVAIDNPMPISYPNYTFGSGNTFTIPLPNSTVPNASRRRLHIDIRNPL